VAAYALLVATATLCQFLSVVIRQDRPRQWQGYYRRPKSTNCHGKHSTIV
jgi:hypothetical protein